jgi:hypothetical protein
MNQKGSAVPLKNKTSVRRCRTERKTSTKQYLGKTNSAKKIAFIRCKERIVARKPRGEKKDQVINKEMT